MENEAIVTNTLETNVPALKAKLPAIIEMPAIGQYLDFRKYLADFYAFKREASKETSARITMRCFQQRPISNLRTI